MRFLERQEFTRDSSGVWSRLSNIESIPTYWHGTRELTASQSGAKITADVVFAFGGKGKAVIMVDEAGRTLTLDYFEGPFKGRQTVAVKGNAVEAEWNVAFNGIYRLLGPLNASHFRSGTRNALRRLCGIPTE